MKENLSDAGYSGMFPDLANCKTITVECPHPDFDASFDARLHEFVQGKLDSLKGSQDITDELIFDLVDKFWDLVDAENEGELS